MRKILLMASVALSALMFSCSESIQDNIIDDGNTNQPTRGINHSGENNEGLRYSLNNVIINPKIVSLNNENSDFISNLNGVYTVEINDSELAPNIKEGNILYLSLDGNAHLKTIVSAKNSGANVYEIETTDAYLGDLFESGSIEFSIDMQKAEEKLKKNSMVLRSTPYEQTFTFDILNYIEEYNNNGLVFNPNTSVKTIFNVKLTFDGKSKVMPSEFIFTYEIKPEFNPYLTFNKSVNHEFAIDMIDYVPADLVKLLEEIELNIEIPAGTLGNIPAKVTVNKINFPSYIFANVAADSNLSYNTAGSFKIGYAYYSNTSSNKSHFIYENTMTSTGIADINIRGEVITDMNLVITPKVSIIDDLLLSATSKISYGFETVTSSTLSTSNKTIAGSRGTFKSSATFDIYSLGINIFSTELFKENKDIWNIGEFDNSMTFSNLKMDKPTKTPCGLLSYNYNITLNYKYPIAGKKVPGTLEITYDVYDDKNALLKKGERSVFTPYNLTESNLKFNLCIPFRADAWAWTAGFMKPLSYIRNAVITDSYGNKGTIADFAVGSPYNNSFWK